MYRNFYNPDDKNSILNTEEIFKVFVDAMIPRTPELADEFGKIQYYGALDLYTDEYLIWSLNNLYEPMANTAAEILEVAARQLVFNQENNFEISKYTGWRTFTELGTTEQFYVLTLLEQLIPFRENLGYILNIISALNRLTYMGYYSEWSGYGSTRLESPNERKLEFFPLSWKQVGYPGPSLGYRAWRLV